MLASEWIFIPLIGFLIGYSTNWLAIKMIFRPYKIKKIGFIRIPFTPGILVRKKELFANKFSETLIKFFLNTHFFLEYIHSKISENKNLLSFLLQKNFIKILNQPIYESIPNIYKDLFKSNYDYYKSQFISFLKNDFEILPLLTKLKDIQSTKDLYLWIYTIESILHSIVNRLLYSIKAESALTYLMDTKVMDDLSLNNFLSNRLYIDLEEYLKNNWDYFLKKLKSLIKDYSLDREIEKIIKNSIQKYLTNQFSQTQKLVSKIWNFENQIDKFAFEITQTLITEVFEYLQLENNRDKIILNLLSYFKDLLDQPINNFSFFEKGDPLLKKIVKESLQQIKYQSLKSIHYRKLSLLILRLIFPKKSDANQKIVNLLSNVVKESNFYTNLLHFVEEKFDHCLFHIPIHDLIKILNFNLENSIIYKPHEEWSDLLVEKLLPIINYFEGIKILDAFEFDLKKNISKKINQFNMKDIEQIIFGIMRNELQWINILGGLIGFMISILQILLLWYNYQ